MREENGTTRGKKASSQLGGRRERAREALTVPLGIPPRPRPAAPLAAFEAFFFCKRDGFIVSVVPSKKRS